MKPIAETTFWIASFLYIVAPIETARILAIIPIPCISHQIALRPLWAALSRKGHDVVLLTTDPVNDPSLTNLTEIGFESNRKLMFVRVNFVKNKMEGSRNRVNIIRNEYWPVCLEFAENIYKHPKVHELYRPDSGEKFDLVIAQTLKTPSLYALAHRFNAPLIGVASLGLYNNNYYLIGAPVLPSHPSAWEIDGAGFNLPLWQRIMNFIQQWYHIYCVLNHFYPENQAIAEKYLGKNIPDLRDMERNMSLIIQNQQEALSFIRPMTSNILSVGNFHILKKLTVLPKDLNEFIADAPNGFIYMSLGTNIKISLFSENVQNIFQDVFASLPYKVLWKHDSELTNKSDNMYIAKWFPQQSVLAHPNIRLFIYQGGLQSTEEAVHYTVPLLGLPMGSDQITQVNKLVSLGVAKKLNVMNLSKENLNATIMDILSDQRYKKRMCKLKKLNEDRPYDLLEHVIWWIEFVIRHKGASHLRTSIAYDPWYQKYDMDVIAILSIAMFITLFCTLIIIYKLLQIIFNFTKLPITKEVTKEKTN